MSYRNKTYVAFASEDIKYYWLMDAWRKNDHIDFEFFNAHDLFQARDTSTPETIKRRLRERMKNAKQIVFLGSKDARRKGGDYNTFLGYEVEILKEFKLPVVVANIDGRRESDERFIPSPLFGVNYYTLSVSFQPKIIKYALDNFSPAFDSSKMGAVHYIPDVYSKLGL